jgi:ATP-dependent helicase/nuclease subunit B
VRDPLPLNDHLAHHRHWPRRWPRPAQRGQGELWAEAAGEAALAAMPNCGPRRAWRRLTPRNIAICAMACCRGRRCATPWQTASRIAFWGSREARVQGADLVILGGLNDGAWPIAAA